MRMEADKSSLLLVDVQEILAPAMAETDRVIANTGVLAQAARRLGVPMLASEHNRKGLGPMVASVAENVPEDGVLEKMSFSCLGDEALLGRIDGLARRQVVLAGLEAHVCVLQTGLDLIERGFYVFIVADATSSRTAENHQLALDRLARSGASVVSTEMVVFEWLGDAGKPEFKELCALIK